MCVELLYIARDASKAVLLLRVPIDSDISLYATTCKGQGGQSEGQHDREHSRETKEKLFCPFACPLLRTLPTMRQPAGHILLGSKGSTNHFLFPCSADTHKAGLPLRLHVDTYIRAMHKGQGQKTCTQAETFHPQLYKPACLVSCTGSLLVETCRIYQLCQSKKGRKQISG
jgi:hypothetical protein